MNEPKRLAAINGKARPLPLTPLPRSDITESIDEFWSRALDRLNPTFVILIG